MMQLLHLGKLALWAGQGHVYTGTPCNHLNIEMTENHINITHKMETKWVSCSTSAGQNIKNAHSYASTIWQNSEGGQSKV